MPSPTPAAASPSSSDALAWLSLACTTLTLLVDPLSGLVRPFVHVNIGLWYALVGATNAVLALVAVGLALLARRHARSALLVGAALGASGVLMLSMFLGWLINAAWHIL